MAKKREDHENESVIITNGKRRYVKLGEQDPEVNFPKKSAKQIENEANKNGKTPEQLRSEAENKRGRGRGRQSNKNEEIQTLSDDAKKTVEAILNHELYTQHTKGVERTDGILAELAEIDLISEQTHEKLRGNDIEINTVADVEKLIEANKE